MYVKWFRLVRRAEDAWLRRAGNVIRWSYRGLGGRRVADDAVHVLHAGDGYTYLTRQVDRDVSRRRGEALSDYYIADGTPPGRWIGSGRVGMGVDGQVSEGRMKALFGEGLHPGAQA